MEIIYLPQAEEDLSYWVKTGNKSILKKIALLTRAVVDGPYKGIGKPEALKYELATDRRSTAKAAQVMPLRCIPIVAVCNCDALFYESLSDHRSTAKAAQVMQLRCRISSIFNALSTNYYITDVYTDHAAIEL